VDAISSIGTLPAILRGVYLASGSSGKGLRAYPGLADGASSPRDPLIARAARYLDLGYYSGQQGIAFTHSSNLVHALHASLKRTRWKEHFQQVAGHTAWLRARLRELGFDQIEGRKSDVSGGDHHPAPGGYGFQPRGGSVAAGRLPGELQQRIPRGKNWIQICFMGECARDKIVSLTNALNRICFKKHKETPDHEKPVTTG